MVMQPLQVQLHTDIPHSPKHDLMLKLWEIPDHTVEIIIILVLDIPGTNKMMDITGISRGMIKNMLGLMRDTISSIHPLCTHPSSSLNNTFPEALSRSLLQIAENQLRTIEAMKASQEGQAQAYREMMKTNKMRDDDVLFHSIEVYDGSNPVKFEKWMDSIDQVTCITGRNLKKELMKKSDSVVRNTLSMMDHRWSDNDIITKLCQDFSSLSTMNRVREDLKNLYKEPGEPVTLFIYKYGQMHYLSTGIRAEKETHLFTITGFITALEPKLNKMVARKYSDTRDKPRTLEAIFQIVERCSKKMLEANSLDRGNTSIVLSTFNEITEVNMNEVTQGQWNSNGNYGNKQSNKSWNKQDGYKGKKDFDKKPWQNKDQKSWNKDQKSQYGNKGSKPKDACISVTKYVKYFCPTGFDEGTFNVVTKLLHKKVEQAKRTGADIKSINAVECESFINIFKVPEQLYDAAYTQVIGETTPDIFGNDCD